MFKDLTDAEKEQLKEDKQEFLDAQKVLLDKLNNKDLTVDERNELKEELKQLREDAYNTLKDSFQ
jgi:hypothetical protein